jgi:hypothetical protein
MLEIDILSITTDSERRLPYHMPLSIYMVACTIVRDNAVDGQQCITSTQCKII